MKATTAYKKKVNPTSATNTNEAWKQEQQEKLGALLERLEAGVASVQDSEGFKRWLRATARFHQYSLSNIILIGLQCPTATQVAGYKTWQSLGRQVKRGEKALTILAPRPYRVTDHDVTNIGSGSGEEKVVRQSQGIGFRTVGVFDISQTEGAELPNLGVTPLVGEDEAALDLYSRLLIQAEVEGLRVTNDDPQHHYQNQNQHNTPNENGEEGSEQEHAAQYQGYYIPAQKLIFVKRQAPMHMAKTLAHELGHHFDPAREGSRREECEAVAEAVGFVITAWAGLDSSSYSFPYIASWAAQQDGPQLIRVVLTRIQRAVHLVLDRLEPRPEPKDCELPD